MTSDIDRSLRPTGLHEMVLEVADLEAAVRFYQNVIGLDVVQRWGNDRPAVWLDMGDSGALGLWTAKAAVGAIANGRGGAHVHFALRIPQGSIDAVQQRLSGLGYETLRIEFDDENRSLYLDDPDGNCVELMDAVVDWAGRPIDSRTAGSGTMLEQDRPPFDPETKLGYLETIGRVSGQPRETEIWFGYENGTIFILSGGGLKKDWIRNFQKTPRVRFRVGDTWVTGTASVVEDDALDQRIRRVVAGKYYDFDPDGDAPLPNEWSRTAVPVMIDLDQA